MMTTGTGLYEERNPANRNFRALLLRKWAEQKFLCIGLDSDWDKIPEVCKSAVTGSDLVAEAIRVFNFRIVNATKRIAGAYKLNLGFYLKKGVSGIKALEKSIIDIHAEAPDVPVILDGKFGDIGNTNAAYAAFAFDEIGADAVTLHNYMGYEAMLPFLERENKGIFILCKTSNPGSGEFQDLLVRDPEFLKDAEALFLRVARNVANLWDKHQNCGLVAGATYPAHIAAIRKEAPELPLLIPGAGKQTKDMPDPVRSAVTAGWDEHREGFLLNDSSAIIFASSDADYAEAAAEVALKRDNEIRACYA